nr:MAG: DNA pilot protein [Microvirus sp.]
MDPFGIGTAVSGIVGAGLSYKGAREANATNKKLAREQMQFQEGANQKQMDFQERMSNTAYQRSRADMEAAGLNPILAFQQGGASSPSGATSGGAKAEVSNEYSGAVGSALQAMQVKAQIAQTKVMTELMKADLPERKQAAEIFQGKGGPWLKWFKELATPFTQTAKGLSPFLK